MQRRSAATGLVVDSSRILLETVGELSDIERGAAMFASGHISRGVTS